LALDNLPTMMKKSSVMQFIFYCACGGAGVASDLLIFYVTLLCGAWYQIANLIGYLFGTVVSFFLNREITFNVRDKVFIRLAFFMGAALVGFITSALLMWLMIDFLSVDAKIAKLLTLPAVIIIQYSINRRITFKI
jgi:putative flippase GtrA